MLLALDTAITATLLSIGGAVGLTIAVGIWSALVGLRDVVQELRVVVTEMGRRQHALETTVEDLDSKLTDLRVEMARGTS